MVEHVVGDGAEQTALQHVQASRSHDDVRASVAVHAEDDHLPGVRPVLRVHAARDLRWVNNREF